MTEPEQHLYDEDGVRVTDRAKASAGVTQIRNPDGTIGIVRSFFPEQLKEQADRYANAPRASRVLYGGPRAEESEKTDGEES